MGRRKKENLRYKDLVVYTIVVFVVLLPFCVYAHVEKLSELAAQYFENTQGYVADFFLYHKEVLLVVFAVWLILFFIGEHIYPKNPVKDIPLRSKQARFVLICVGIYGLAIVFSSIFATDRKTAWWGCCNEYEGMVALLSYQILFLAGYNYFRGSRHRDMLKSGLVVLMTILAVLALVENLYMPIYEIDFMKYLIAPSQYREMASGLSNVGFLGQTTLSFYNPAYLASLCAMLIPVCFGFAYEEEKTAKRVGYFFLDAALWLTLLSTRVTGAFFAAIVGILVVFVALRREGRKLFAVIGMWGIILLVSFLAVNLVTEGALADRVLVVVSNRNRTRETKKRFVVESIELTEGKLKVSSAEDTFWMERGVTEQLVLQTLKVTDETGKEIPTELSEDGTLRILSEELEAVSLSYYGGILSLDLGYEETVDFYVTEEGFLLVGQNGAPLTEIPQSKMKSEFLKKAYPVATGRGYMWVNTFPILKECILIGKGPGNFAYAFPQNEVAGLLNTHGSCKFVVDKPHSWYLQIAVSTGMISLVAVLALLFRYFGKGTQIYCVQKIKNISTLEISLWGGLFAFCITGLVNDSIVTVNPIFWLLLGVGSCAVDNK